MRDLPIFFIFAVLFSCGSMDDAKSSDEIALHPPWALSDSWFLNSHKTLSLDGSTDSVTVFQWKQWEKNISKLPYRAKLSEIILTHGIISAPALNYFSCFENIERLSLGRSIEGIIIPVEALNVLEKFKNLRELHISIHGLRNEHLRIISNLKQLEALAIEFPSRHMVSESEMKEWTPTILTDGGAREISNITALVSLTISIGPSEIDGEVRFTEEALNSFMSLPNIEQISISSKKIFIAEELEKIRIRKLPEFVRID